MTVVLKYFPHLLREDSFVRDPDDGLPGYLDKRSWTLDMLDVGKANQNSSYCHAAISMKQDLEYEQGLRRHCNKSVVGDSLGVIVTGMPISERYSPNLRALFSKMINLNVLSKANNEESPPPRCEMVESQIRGETNSLSVEQLGGIWIVTAAFASLGLLVHYFKPWVRIRILSRKERMD